MIIRKTSSNYFLISEFLSSVLKDSKKGAFSKVQLEKLLVLLLKSIQYKEVFDITYDIKDINSLNISYYLYGPIVVSNKKDDKERGVNINDWLSTQLIKSGFLKKTPSGIKPVQKSKEAFLLRAGSLNEVRTLGLIIGKVINELNLLKDNELIILTCTREPIDIINAIHAEITIFMKQWSIPSFKLTSQSKGYIALNSGWFKMRAFLQNESSQIIKKVQKKLSDPLYQDMWSSLWSSSDIDLEILDNEIREKIIRYFVYICRLNLVTKIFLAHDHNLSEKESKRSLAKISSFSESVNKSTNHINKLKLDQYTKHLLDDLQNKLIISQESIIQDTNGIIYLNSEINLVLKYFKDEQPLQNNFINKLIGVTDSIQRKESKSSVKKRKTKSSNEIHVLLASPSDTIKEREYITAHIEREFRVRGYESNCNKRLLLHRWEDIAPQEGHPQDIINGQIEERIDIVLAFFKHKLGTPTIHPDGKERSKSGTVEELLLTLDISNINRPLGMLYFFNKSPLIDADDPDSLIKINNWKVLKSFKQSINSRLIYKNYENEFKLLEMILIDINNNLRELFG